MRKILQLAACVGLTALATTGPAIAGTNLLFILDVSGSMAGKVDGTPKIDTAKDALLKMLVPGALPEGTKVGMMLYGHRSKSDCQDVELTEPIGSASFSFLKSKPLGKTPLAYALHQSIAAFANLAGQNNNIILLTDGIESCNGDPCNAAAELVAAGIGMRVQVVGFTIDPKDRAQLQCIADKGNGKYYSADHSDELLASLNQAVEAAAQAPEPAPQPEVKPAPEPEPTPVPAEKARKVIFSDEFEGSELSKDWDVGNPNGDYSVEKGTLLTVSATPGGLANPDIPNTFKLVGDLPNSDYTVTVKLNVAFATGKEIFAAGLFDDKDNYLTASLLARSDCCYPQAVDLKIIKVSGGQPAEFVKPVFEFAGQTSGMPFDKGANAVAQPIILKLIKEGHNFSASANFAGQKDDAGNPVWVTTDAVTALRPPKTLVMNPSQSNEVPGETTFTIDSITIDVPADSAQ